MPDFPFPDTFPILGLSGFPFRVACPKSTKTEAQTEVSTEMDTGTVEQAELQSQTEGKSQTRPQPEVKDVRNGDLLGPLSLKGACKYWVYGYVKRF